MLSISKNSVMTIIKDLGYSKVCAQWVPRMPTDRHKEARRTIITNLLHHYETEGDNSLSNIVTGMASHNITHQERNKEMYYLLGKLWPQCFGIRRV
jgi:hypothetical protein